MRKYATLFLAGLLAAGVSQTGRADDSSEARAIVDRAIEAAGGEAALAKFQSMTWKEKGTYYGMGDGLPYTGTYAIQWPDRFRMEIANAFTIVLNGDHGWMQTGGNTEEMTRDQLAEQKQERYVGWVTSLLPLTRGKYHLASVGESKVDGRPAVGVKVVARNHRDVTLYFDKASGLVVKSQYGARAMEDGGKKVTQEAYYANYREVNGAKMPSKIVIKRDGKRFVEAEITELKPAPTFGPRTFSKP